MARSGFSTSNYLLLSSAVLTTTPITMACWANVTSLTTTQILMELENSGSAFNLNDHRMEVVTTPGIRAVTADGSSSALALSSAGPTTNTWFHAAAVFASATSRSAYFNGANKVSNTTSKTPSGIDQTVIGVGHGSTTGNPVVGSLAEAAIWNIALSDGDILALSKGLSPLLMHPEALVAYWPLVGNNSPENNIKSNSATMSIVGSLSAAAHPRIFMPRHRLIA